MAIEEKSFPELSVQTYDVDDKHFGNYPQETTKSGSSQRK